ncbi:MAG: hypothetical protein U1G07_14395, partial [Verrucomicrobiota bacterium]
MLERAAKLSAGAGMVLSDLHLFARRSHASLHLEALGPELARAPVVVLNGDTFDFRWSTVGDHEASRLAAVGWLREFARTCRQADIHFVLGNHDCLAGFAGRLQVLSEEEPRFHWHRHGVRLGAAMFLHGDCALGWMDGAGLARYRSAWENDTQRGEWAGWAYRWADRLGLTRLAHAGQFPRRVAVTRVAYYLDRTVLGWREEVRECY